VGGRSWCRLWRHSQALDYGCARCGLPPGSRMRDDWLQLVRQICHHVVLAGACQGQRVRAVRQRLSAYPDAGGGGHWLGRPRLGLLCLPDASVPRDSGRAPQQAPPGRLCVQGSSAFGLAGQSVPGRGIRLKGIGGAAVNGRSPSNSTGAHGRQVPCTLGPHDGARPWRQRARHRLTSRLGQGMANYSD